MFRFNQPRPAAAGAHLEGQISMCADMTTQICSAMQRVSELNLRVAQTLIEETLTNTRQMLSAKNLPEALSVIASQVRPNAEKVRAYQRHLANIAAGMQVDLAKIAQTHVAQTTRTSQELAIEAARRASEETENATKRQRATMDKFTSPIAKPGQPSKGNTRGLH